MTIYAIQGSDNADRISKSLQRGEGRFGWSYIESANLRDLRERIEQYGWESLSDEEKDCYHDFLLEIEPGDYVVYINVPAWGECTLAKVTGRYFWRCDDDDFNHRFKVSAKSIHEFNRNDAMVPPLLNARLKLQSRWWKIYTEEEFDELLTALVARTTPTQRTPDTNLRYLSEKIEPNLLEITKKIHESHPNKALENFVAKVFQKVPGVKDVRPKRGRADHGADLLVDIESGSIPGLIRQDTLLVQVKSWGGIHHKTSAVDDLRKAFKYYEKNENVSMGLIVSTADKAGDKLISELDKLREEHPQKPISLLIGTELALFVLKYASDILN